MTPFIFSWFYFGQHLPRFHDCIRSSLSCTDVPAPEMRWSFIVVHICSVQSLTPQPQDVRQIRTRLLIVMLALPLAVSSVGAADSRHIIFLSSVWNLNDKNMCAWPLCWTFSSRQSCCSLKQMGSLSSICWSSDIPDSLCLKNMPTVQTRRSVQQTDLFYLCAAGCLNSLQKYLFGKWKEQ